MVHYSSVLGESLPKQPQSKIGVSIFLVTTLVTRNDQLASTNLPDRNNFQHMLEVDSLVQHVPLILGSIFNLRVSFGKAQASTGAATERDSNNQWIFI